MIDATGEALPGDRHVRRHLRDDAARLSAGFHAGGHIPLLRCSRQRAGSLRLRALLEFCLALLRGHDERSARCRATFRLHGHDPGAFGHRRGASDHHGATVRAATRRARLLGRDRRCHPRGLDRRRRRHRRHHGPDQPAGDAAGRLRYRLRRPARSAPRRPWPSSFRRRP